MYLYIYIFIVNMYVKRSRFFLDIRHQYGDCDWLYAMQVILHDMVEEDKS